MSSLGDTLAGRVERYVEGLDVSDVFPLSGDASNRAYYRLHLASGETRVLALLPDAFEADALPFLNVMELMHKIPIRVPRVFDVAGDRGILLLEDLGDRLLQDEVNEAEDDRKNELYRNALDLLRRLQTRGAELESERYLPFRIAFDEAKFVQELEFFREHFVEGLRSASLTPEEKDSLYEAFTSIAAELCDQPFVLCHRDYHSRNLMLTSGELVWIDFQDARRGPRAYDLVSLLNDSYVEHSPDFVREMTEYFERAIGADVARDTDLAALQRNLKALGTFGFQISRRQNIVYEQYVGRTLALVRSNLERNPRWDGLRRILARHCEELGS